MTTELTLLALSIVLGFVHILLNAHTTNFQRGYRWAASARDETVAPLHGWAGRLERALRNYLETFPFFAAAVLVVHMAEKEGALTLWGAHLYFWGRLVFLILYALGVPYFRSLVWNVATLGILLILLALV